MDLCESSSGLVVHGWRVVIPGTSGVTLSTSQFREGGCLMSFVDGSVRVDRVGDSLWIVELHGEHDLSTAAELRTELATIFAQGTTVVVDLTETTFIDSAVLSELISAQHHVEDLEGKRLAIVAPAGGFPARVIDLVDAARLFAMFGRRADALRWAACVASG